MLRLLLRLGMLLLLLGCVVVLLLDRVLRRLLVWMLGGLVLVLARNAHKLDRIDLGLLNVVALEMLPDPAFLEQRSLYCCFLLFICIPRRRSAAGRRHSWTP